MKYIFILLTILNLSYDFCYGQIKIGDNPEVLNTNSLLELESSSKVLVISRMSNGEMLQLIPLEGALVFNTDENCVYYFDGQVWVSLCNQVTTNGSVTLNDNGDGTYTFTNNDDPDITFNGADETLSTLVSNLDSTYTYTNENGIETLLTLGGGSLVDNLDGTYTFTNSDGSEITINNSNTEEATSSLEDNLDGTYTYTDELGEITEINTNTTVESFSGEPGSVVFAGIDGKPAEDNQSLFYNENLIQLGVGTASPNSTVSVNGSLSNAIRFAGGDVGLSELDHTVIINGSGNNNLFLPPTNESIGRMYIIKKNPAITMTVPSGYVDSAGVEQFVISAGINVIWLQSDGFSWQQVN